MESSGKKGGKGRGGKKGGEGGGEGGGKGMEGEGRRGRRGKGRGGEERGGEEREGKGRWVKSILHAVPSTPTLMTLSATTVRMKSLRYSNEVSWPNKEEPNTTDEKSNDNEPPWTLENRISLQVEAVANSCCLFRRLTSLSARFPTNREHST